MGDRRGWLATPALAPGGTRADELAIKGDQIAASTITEANLDADIVAKLNLDDDPMLTALDELLLEVTRVRDIVLLILSKV